MSSNISNAENVLVFGRVNANLNIVQCVYTRSLHAHTMFAISSVVLLIVFMLLPNAANRKDMYKSFIWPALEP